MRYGHFDDERREYVIERPDTPLPWINYLGDEDYFALLSNTAGGYSFYRDARLRRLIRYRYNNARSMSAAGSSTCATTRPAIPGTPAGSRCSAISTPTAAGMASATR